MASPGSFFGSMRLPLWKSPRTNARYGAENITLGVGPSPAVPAGRRRHGTDASRGSRTLERQTETRLDGIVAGSSGPLEKQTVFRQPDPGTSLAVGLWHIAGLIRGSQSGEAGTSRCDVPFFCVRVTPQSRRVGDRCNPSLHRSVPGSMM